MEDVDDEIDVVDEHPPTTLEALDVFWAEIDLFQFLDDVLGDRLYVDIRPTRGEQEIIRRPGDTGEVERDHVSRLPLEGQLRRSFDGLGDFRPYFFSDYRHILLG